MTEVAFASGFSSLRRFNDAFTRATGCRRRVCAERRPMALQRSPRARRRPCSCRIVRPMTGRRPRVSGRACAHRDRARDRQFVCQNRAAWRGEGLDLRDEIEEAARAPGRVHAHADASSAGAAQPRAGAVRSRRAARRHLEASRPRRAPGAGGEGQPRDASARRLQRIRDGAARDPRSASLGESGHDDRRPIRRSVRRIHRHAAARTESPDTGAGSNRQGDASTTSPDAASSRREPGASSR